MKYTTVWIAAVALALLTFCLEPLRAQEPADSQARGDYSARTHAISESDSRAEKEAERLVSLSPERIILILQQEPGLFLEVKKMLVRQAYGQGRVLLPTELTDEAVFRLVRDDDETRALITEQMVKRGYIRAKPTPEEFAKQEEDQQKLAAAARGGQEPYAEEYGQNEQESTRPGQSRPGSSGTRQNAPAYGPNLPSQTAPPFTTPQNQMNDDQRRALLQASLGSSGGGEETQGLPFDAVTGGGNQQISSDQLQQLMSAYRSGQLPTNGAGMPDMAQLAALKGAGNAAPAQQPQSQEDAYMRSTQLTQQASLETRPPAFQQQPHKEITNDRPSLLHRANPYADVPSLYDLYAQYSRRPGELKRFGLDVFENGTGNFNSLPMDLPAGPDYVVGPGDGLNIDLWGSVSRRLHEVVDREGRLSLPEVGSIQVAGDNLGDVQRIVQSALRSQFRQLEADVSLDGLRTVRVYVVGDVKRPGAYDVSSLSTPLNALYQAGGPTTRGSMRVIKHYRGNQLVENVDLYDLLLHGVRSNMQRLESGDTILVPPIGQQITIEGMVRRPAIYELAGEKSLADVLELAGGVLPSGTLRHVDVERVQAHQDRTMLRVDMPEGDDTKIADKLEQFTIQDGDRVKISPILPFAEKTVYLDGHVFRPGKYAYRDGMKITDLVHAYSDLLPEPYQQHAEIIRLNAPDLEPQIIAFNLADALSGKAEDVALKPFDTVRIFGRFDFEDPPIITVDGEVRDPGDHLTNGKTYLRDAVFLAGNTTPDAELQDVQVFRKTQDGKLEVLDANLSKAIAGDSRENILLQPQDRVFVHKNVSRADPPTVEVAGEVARPGKYPLGASMTAAELVRLSGGLKRSAYTEVAELTRYSIENGNKVEVEHIPVKLADAISGEADTDMRLHPGDVLTVQRMAGWKDIGATVKLDGEVIHPGTYGIQAGERLSDVLARAGGLRAEAYPYGTIFERAEIRDLEEKNRAQLITTAKQEGGGVGTADAAQAQWRDTVQKLQTTPPVGRMVIHISDRKSWIHSPADVQLAAGDSIYVPKRPNFVMVQGAVYNQTAISFRPGKSANWYLRQAGGVTSSGDKKRVFIVRADGTVAGGTKTLFNGGALDTALAPGDMVVVPSKAYGGGLKWRETLQAAQVVSAIGIAVQVARGF